MTRCTNAENSLIVLKTHYRRTLVPSVLKVACLGLKFGWCYVQYFVRIGANTHSKRSGRMLWHLHGALTMQNPTSYILSELLVLTPTTNCPT